MELITCSRGISSSVYPQNLLCLLWVSQHVRDTKIRQLFLPSRSSQSSSFHRDKCGSKQLQNNRISTGRGRCQGRAKSGVSQWGIRVEAKRWCWDGFWRMSKSLLRRPFQGAGRSVYKEAEAGKKVWRRANSLVQWEHRSLEVIVERWAGPCYQRLSMPGEGVWTYL